MQFMAGYVYHNYEHMCFCLILLSYIMKPIHVLTFQTDPKGIIKVFLM